MVSIDEVYLKSREKCPMTYVANAIGGKWKANILYILSVYEGIRYGQLKRLLPETSHKVLNEQLKELIDFGLVYRTQYEAIPLKVEYRLTQKGKSTLPMLKVMYEWGKANIS